MEFEIVEGINPHSWQQDRAEQRRETAPRQHRRVPDQRQSALLIPESEECLRYPN